VTLDARLTRQMSTGMKLYVRELVQRLPRVAPDLSFVVVSNAPLDPQLPNIRRIALDDAAAANGGAAEQIALPRALAHSGARLVHYMSVYAPRRLAIPHVYTIHDVIHLRYPGYFSWKVPWYYRLVVRPVAQTALNVITDAAATAGDLMHFLGVKPAQIRVVPLAAAEEFSLSETDRQARAARARIQYDIRRPYVLYAGNHREHKNLRVLVEAWRRLPDACDLVITEDAPPGALDALIGSTRKDNGHIVRCGHVAQAALVDLYAGAIAAVQPSLYEGFGLSVLEAMAAGTPAIVARTPALVELAGQAALIFPPGDAGALESAMKQLLNDGTLQQRLRERGRVRAAEFSWDATARQTAAVYREALRAAA